MEQKIRTEQEEKELLAYARTLLFGALAIPAFWILLKGFSFIQLILFGYVQ